MPRQAAPTNDKGFTHLFSPLGQIEVLYINPCQVKQDYISGGVVMSNGKQYQFTYHSRQISFEEDKG
ncbi:DUF4651 domain-containing protein [Streptococcus pyogenes]|uniref:DUF4651 domain-containing protein n=1 Tax=Streptococcus pyogenes TaxID=1314 RepID=UPI002F944D20